MATSAPTLLQERVRAGTGHRLLGLWHLCSLDAPTVAVVWTAFVARASGIALPWTSLAAMGLAVWVLYVLDRLLDARAGRGDLEARHRFHQRHRRVFHAGLAIALLALVPLLRTLPWAAMRLYLVEGALLAGWFALIHLIHLIHFIHSLRGAVRLPKELAVGPFFAAAVFIPTVARAPQLRPALLLPAVLLALVCCLNCLFIYAWEHPALSAAHAHATTRWAVRYLPWIAAAVAAAAFVLSGWLGMACALAACLLLALHAMSRRIRPLTLRALADVALLTPLLLLGWMA